MKLLKSLLLNKFKIQCADSESVMKFQQNIQRFKDAELLYSVYESKTLCVCNIADTCYAVFNYTETQDGFWGVIVIPEHAKQIVEDNRVFSYLLSKWNEDELFESSFFLNDKAFGIMKDLKSKNKTANNLGVDIKWETKIMNRYSNI